LTGAYTVVPAFAWTSQAVVEKVPLPRVVSIQ